jgi:hypothetical protein
MRLRNRKKEKKKEKQKERKKEDKEKTFVFRCVSNEKLHPAYLQKKSFFLFLFNIACFIKTSSLCTLCRM